MFDAQKIKIKFFLMKIKWRLKNRNNYTYPKHLCDINIIDIGDYTYGGIDAESFGCINSHLTIGRFCSIAQNVRFILDGEHYYKTISTYPFKVRLLGENVEAICKGTIIVGDDVWIGERAIILSGVTIGQGAIIGAGSVVRKNVPPYSIYVGSEIVKYRFDDKIIEKLLTVDFSQLTIDKIKLLKDKLYQNITDNNVDELIALIGVKKI